MVLWDQRGKIGVIMKLPKKMFKRLLSPRPNEEKAGDRSSVIRLLRMRMVENYSVTSSFECTSFTSSCSSNKSIKRVTSAAAFGSLSGTVKVGIQATSAKAG